MVKQNKGKSIEKIPLSKLVDGPYYVSKKYDGHYTQLEYKDGEVQMWTSGGKEFYLYGLGEYIKEIFSEDFHIECEFNFDCEGYLGDRGKSAILTTYRTNHKKDTRIYGKEFKDIFTVLDIIDLEKPFSERLNKLNKLFKGHEQWFRIPYQTMVQTLAHANRFANMYVKEGYEGAVLKAPDHMYQPGKRVNNIIKIKPRLTADLLCVGIKDGAGKYEGMIGSLILEDSEGRIVSAGSGLSDIQRSCKAGAFIGHVYEIEYERIDETYVQPIIKGPRYDKNADQID